MNYINMTPHTVSFTDLDQGGETIILESVLTTFEASSIFEAAGRQ
jgi:hypothetical protein